MQCPRCQAENREGRRFCGECGLSFASTCATCGFLNEGGEKFCGGCGKLLSSLAASTVPKFKSPEAYTPRHLAEKILTSRAALEGERKQVTVLFADLKGSMELLADRDPEDARKLLDPVLEHMMEAVHRYEGTVNQVMGDGIMALFGAPLAQEDHAVRACYAALRMQESVKRYAISVFRSHGVSVRIRVGLNSGEVVVRAIGSDLHMDYTAVGQTTHLAARMEQLAEPGTTLLTPTTLGLAEGFMQVSARGPVPVKGLAEPVEVYELTGASPVRSRLQAAAAHGLTRFVGRDAELALMRQSLTLAGEGHGQVVAFVGEPGVGKSRLVWEFTHSHRSQGWLVVEAASVSYGKATTYFPVIELLRAYFQIEPRDDVRRVREKVTGKLLSLDRLLEPTLPAFFSLLDALGNDPEWQRLDSPQRRRLTLDALKRFVVRESQVQPLLLVFEDLHWIDGETQAFLDSLVETLPTARILLLVNYRPEYTHGWGGKAYYQQVRLDSLPAAGATELLDALLGTDGGLHDVKRVLIERTQGNPFLLEESVRAMVETRTFVGERGAYHLAGALDDLRLPATAHAILAARIDRLAPEDKRLLQAAAVIGKDVPLALLAAIADEPDERLRAALGRLQAADFLYEKSLFPDLEYTFKHALTLEVAYGSLLHERRKALHARIVEAIEHIFAERFDEQTERLAHHALRGELWEQAVDYNRRAGARAHTRLAYFEAVTLFDRAIEAVEHLPEEPRTQELSVDLRIILRLTLVNAGQPARSLDVCREAIERADALGEPKRRAGAAAGLANSLYIAGRSSEAVDAGLRALALAERLGDPSLLATARWYLAQACEAVGDHARVIDTMEKNLDLCSRNHDVVAYASLTRGTIETVSRSWLAWSLGQRGEFDRAAVVAQPAIGLGEHSGSPWGVVSGLCGVSLMHLFRGELRTAISYLERGLDLCTSSGIRIWFPFYAASLGYAYALEGRFAEARDLLCRSVDDGATEERVHQPRWLAWLGETYLLSGDREQAASLASTALAMARARGERGNEVWALRLHGEMAAAADPPSFTTAETCYHEARALAEQLGMRPLVAHCHLGLGKLYRRTGNGDQAREHFTTATMMFREMGMTYWLEKTEVEMKVLG